MVFVHCLLSWGCFFLNITYNIKQIIKNPIGITIIIAIFQSANSSDEDSSLAT